MPHTDRWNWHLSPCGDMDNMPVKQQQLVHVFWQIANPSLCRQHTQSYSKTCQHQQLLEQCSCHADRPRHAWAQRWLRAGVGSQTSSFRRLSAQSVRASPAAASATSEISTETPSNHINITVNIHSFHTSQIKTHHYTQLHTQKWDLSMLWADVTWNFSCKLKQLWPDALTDATNDAMPTGMEPRFARWMVVKQSLKLHFQHN